MSTEWREFKPTFTGMGYGVVRRMKCEYRLVGKVQEIRSTTSEWVYEIPKIKLPRKLKKKLYGVNGRRRARKLNRAAKNRPPQNAFKITLPTPPDSHFPLTGKSNVFTYEIE